MSKGACARKIAMPTISQFLGMTVRMYFGDHLPPHFHVLYNEHEALMSIEGATVLRGHLPRRVLALATEWATLHRTERADNWQLCADNKAPNKIKPLED